MRSAALDVLYFDDPGLAAEFAESLRLFLESPVGRPLLESEPRAVLWMRYVDDGAIEMFATTGLMQAATDLELYPKVIGRLPNGDLPPECELVVGKPPQATAS
jgi:hypothetical protein